MKVFRSNCDKMVFIFACTILVILNSVCCQESIDDFPPLLNVSKSFVDMPPGMSLTIECRGRKEVRWHYRNIEKWVSPNITTSENKKEDGINYVSLLYLPPSYVFTGLYICSYENWIYGEVRRNASIYVFMNDPRHLFVPQSEFNTTVQVPFDAHPVVRCLPTNSNVNVTLWQHYTSTGEVKRLFTDDVITFDPTKGFFIREPLSRNVSCRGRWKNFQESTSIFRIQVSNNSISKPLIEGTSFEWQVGRNNYLNCSVAIAGEADSKSLKWTYPGFNRTDINVNEGEVHSEGRQSYSFLFVKLNVTPVEATNEGVYSCSLIWKNGSDTVELSKDQTYVTVRAAKGFEPVKFERAIEVPSPIIKEPGKSITFSANVVNFDLSNIEIHWEKNGFLLQESPKYQLQTHSLPVSLTVYNLQLSDAGKYSLFGRKAHKYTTGNISFLLAIESVPAVQILQPHSDKFYEAGNVFEIKCQVKSFPQSKITWLRKTCSSWELCDGAEKTIVTDNTTISEEILENPIFQVSSGINVTAIDSGIYYCEAVNSIGQNEASIPFIVTDNFEGKPVILDVNDPNPDGNSKVNVKCQITSMVYKDIIWYFVQVPGNYNMEALSKLSGFNITPRNKTYTEVSSLSFNARKNRSGLYACSFLDKRSNKQIDKFIGVYISSDAIPPPSPTPVTEGDDSMTATTVTIVISVVVAAAVLIIITIVAVAVKIKKKNSRFNAFNFQQGQIDLINPNLPLEDQVDLLPYDPRWEFPKDRLKLGRVIGHGAFGRVVKADAIGLEPNVPFTTVAVKMLKNKNDESQYKALMAELKIMIHLGRHVNILNLMGAVTKNLFKGELMVMVEYCCHGNLRSYLLKHREKFVDQIDPETRELNPDILHDNTISEESKQSDDYSKPIALGISNPSYKNYSSTGQLLKRISIGQADAARSTTSAGSSLTTGGDTSISTAAGSESGYSSTGEAINFAIGGKEAARYSGILTTSDLLCYCFQCAQGMSYLASRKLLHRDLAARNILLAEGNVIKISDFGLSKDVYKYSKYVKKSDGPLPVKWMAIESIKDRIFTTKSDVWSFGILMWEIFTLGGNPYPGFEMNEEFFRRLQEGYRLQKPPYSPDNVYQVMLDCWNSNPKDRPDFSFLGEQLGGMLEATVKEHYIDLNAPYSSLNNDLRSLEDYLSMSTPNYLELSDQVQDTNVDRDLSNRNISESNSAQEKPHYCNIPPIVSEQVVIENVLDLKNTNAGTDLPIDRVDIASKAIDKDMLYKKNSSAQPNSSTNIKNETEEIKEDESQSKNPDYLFMT